MEYKYYKKEGEGYKRTKAGFAAYFLIILFLVLGAVGIWYRMDTGKMGGIYWFLFCLAVIGMIYYRQMYVAIIIQPKDRQVVIRHGQKVYRSYPFDKFMNYQKTQVRNNGITTQWHVSMYMDDNGKNKHIFLGVVARQKAADQLIAETDALMKGV